VNYPQAILSHLRSVGSFYWPGVGFIRLIRLPSSYNSLTNTLSAPEWVLERAQSGSNDGFPQESSRISNDPELLKWLHHQASHYNHLFNTQKVLPIREWLSLSEILPTIAPSTSLEIVQLTPVSERRTRKWLFVLLSFFLMAGMLYRPLSKQLQAGIGQSINWPDFQSSLSVIESSNSTQSVPEPYFHTSLSVQKSFVLVSGVFAKVENAQRWVKFMESKGIESAMIPGPSGLIRVATFPIDTDFEAVQKMHEMNKYQGISTWVLPI
jgi:hypothetical protein